MTGLITVTRHNDLDTVQDLLVDIYAHVYADRLTDPFFSTDRFIGRLQRHAAEPGWEAAIGYDGPTPVGYAYGAVRQAGTSYWSTVTPSPDPDFVIEDGTRTLVLFELMILPPWRGTGASTAVHDALLAGRPQQRVTLAVEHDHPRVRALYESWGYHIVGRRQPTPDSPIMDIMWKPLQA